MADDLKPCPFCGGAASAWNLAIEGAVRCENCEATISRRHNRIDDTGYYEAIAAWNTRYTPDDDDPACTCCGGTGITYQTERRCACQPAPTLAEALDVPEVASLIEAAKDVAAILQAAVKSGALRGGDTYRIAGAYLVPVSDALDAVDAALARITGEAKG